MFERCAVVVLALVAVGAGCFVADVGEAAIACDVATECPEPLFCDGGFCRRGNAADSTPPGVVGGSARLGEGTIRPGSGTSLSFVATEALGETPRFVAEGLAFGDVDERDGPFVVNVTALAGAAEDGHAIDVVLVDVVGNTSEPVFLATLTVDATPPVLAASQGPTTVPPDQAFVVGGTASEALTSATCTFTPVFGGDDTVVTGVVDGADFSCDGPPLQAADTAVRVSATLVDLAGNEADVDLSTISIF